MLCTSSVFFFNDTATTEIYTLSLHDALPIYEPAFAQTGVDAALEQALGPEVPLARGGREPAPRSEEHTSELQSHVNLVCRLLLEKKKETSVSKQGEVYAKRSSSARLRHTVAS